MAIEFVQHCRVLLHMGYRFPAFVCGLFLSRQGFFSWFHLPPMKLPSWVKVRGDRGRLFLNVKPDVGRIIDWWLVLWHISFHGLNLSMILSSRKEAVSSCQEQMDAFQVVVQSLKSWIEETTEVFPALQSSESLSNTNFSCAQVSIYPTSCKLEPCVCTVFIDDIWKWWHGLNSFWGRRQTSS